MSVDIEHIRRKMKYMSVYWSGGNDDLYEAHDDVEAMLDEIEALRTRCETAEKAATHFCEILHDAADAPDKSSYTYPRLLAKYFPGDTMAMDEPPSESPYVDDPLDGYKLARGIYTPAVDETPEDSVRRMRGSEVRDTTAPATGESEAT